MHRAIEAFRAIDIQEGWLTTNHITVIRVITLVSMLFAVPGSVLAGDTGIVESGGMVQDYGPIGALMALIVTMLATEVRRFREDSSPKASAADASRLENMSGVIAELKSTIVELQIKQATTDSDMEHIKDTARRDHDVVTANRQRIDSLSDSMNTMGE